MNDLDHHPLLIHNFSMSTTTPKPNELIHGLEESLARIMRGERDPERMGKALAEARRGREEMRQRIGGVLDVCVDLVRESRDQ